MKSPLAAVALVAAAILIGNASPAGAKSASTRQDVSVTASAPYRPVKVPGTQRRVAQNDAEAKGRELIRNQMGSVSLPRGGTINDVMARNSVLRAEILNAIRTAEVTDWKVDPACGQVTVWMRLDMNCIYGILAKYGYY